MSGRRTVFLDRDGVLVEDRGLALADGDLALLPGVPAALDRLSTAGWELVVVTNQPVVARGLIDEDGLIRLHGLLAGMIAAQGGPLLRHWRVCPHHPEADLPDYRVDCPCRKPKPGLLLAAAAELGLDMAASWMVGDRPSDIAAGLRAGCATILVESGRHDDAPIRSSAPPRPDEQPRHRVGSLGEAVGLILACDARGGA